MLSQSKNIIWKKIGDESVFLDTRNGHYYLTNETGSRIWTLLVEGKSVDEAASIIISEFNTTFDESKADIEALVESLIEAGIIMDPKS